MENTFRISASVVSKVGRFCANNEDNFYINGRLMYGHETDNIQVSVDNSGNEYVFAVSDCMDRELSEKNSHISAVKELKKIHDKISRIDKDIEFKAEQIGECLEEANNLVLSAGLSAAEDSKKAAFAGLLLSGRKASVFNLGNSRVYFMRKGNVKLLTSDSKKAERLMKMGILTNEQADELASIPAVEMGAKKAVRRLESFGVEPGDVFLLCTNGLCDEVDEDRISQVAASGEDTGHMANILVGDAVENGGEENMTVLVVRVEEVSGASSSRSYVKRQTITPEPAAPVRRTVAASARTDEDDEDTDDGDEDDEDEDAGQVSKYRIRSYSKSPRYSLRKQRIVQQVASTAAAVVIIAAAIFGAYKLWGFLSQVENEEQALAQPTTSAEALTEGTATQEATTLEETSVLTQETVKTAEGTTTQQYKLPLKHTVQKGESLYMLSRKYYNNDYTKYKLIMEANNLKDPNSIKIGQVLTIPALK